MTADVYAAPYSLLFKSLDASLFSMMANESRHIRLSLHASTDMVCLKTTK